jgi:iron(III) transport system ATP-binding protein
METRKASSVRLEHLTKMFGAITAVSDVSFEIPAGALVCLVGPSGCGKTTTLRMIGGFEEPTAGHIYIGNQCVDAQPPYDRPTAMVFQSYALFPHMTVYENVSYGLRVRHKPTREIEECVHSALALLELQGLESKSPRQLSGGQQQRVALARALVTEPEVLLLDEPLSNLDAQLRVRVRGEIRALQRQLGITAIYVTHDQEEAFSLSDFTAIMQAGKLIQVGKPMDIYRRPTNTFVAHFVGLSNIVHVEALEVRAQDATVRALDHVIHVAVPPPSRDGKFAVVLRPEMMHLCPADRDGIAARVKTATFLGPLIRYVVVTGAGLELTVDVTNPTAEQLFSEGTAVAVHLPDQVPGLLAV